MERKRRDKERGGREGKRRDRERESVCVGDREWKRREREGRG